VASIQGFRELVEVFYKKCDKEAFRIFVVTARQIWFRHNKWIHERVFTHPSEIVHTAAMAIVDYTEA
jgi:hypothetical protein